MSITVGPKFTALVVLGILLVGFLVGYRVRQAQETRALIEASDRINCDKPVCEPGENE